MKIQSANALLGRVKVPGDKSISHRAAILSSMATGTADIENFSSSEDCTSTLNSLAALGVEIHRIGDSVRVLGVGKRGFKAPDETLDCGNSGTTMRLMSGLLAGQPFESVLSGDSSLNTRPMTRVIGPLELMGAMIESDGGTAPIKIKGKRPLAAINYRLPVASAQLKTAVLLAGLNANGITRVESVQSEAQRSALRDHTELMLEYLGAEISQEFLQTDDSVRHIVGVDGTSNLISQRIIVPGDISSTSFFLVAAACLDGSDIVLKNVGLNPTRTAVIDVLREMGASIQVTNQRKFGGEIAGDVSCTGNGRMAQSDSMIRIRGSKVANLIDEIPVLAVLGTQTGAGIEFRDAGELRVKESDRISAVVSNLKLMGAAVEEFPDGMKVMPSSLTGARLDSFGDHRIAMAFAVAGLLADGETEIVDGECVNISFPGFFKTLSGVTR